MKILVVQESDWVGRGPHQSHHLMERLSEKGHEVRVIDFEIGWRSNRMRELISKRKVFDDVCNIVEGGYVTVIRPPIIKFPVLDYVSLLYTHNREIKRQLEEFNPDVIVGFGILNASLALRLARKRNIPSIYYLLDELHRLVPQKFFQPVARYMESRNLRRADRVIVINEKLRDYVVGMGADPEKTHLIRAGVDTIRFNPGNDGAQVREEYGIKKGDTALFFMGWLYTFSGLKEVASGLAEIRNENIKLLIVGEGELYDELKGIREKNGLQNRIILTGRQPYEKIPGFIAASDICLLPAHNNEIMRNIVPIKIYEYMAAGKPVIATELPGVMKEFGEGNGVIYVKDSADVLAKAIEFGNNEIAELGKKARRFVEPLDWNKMTSDFEGILSEEIMNSDCAKTGEGYIIVDSEIGEYKGNNVDLDNPPKVSFAIPTFNNEDTLDECLRSISSQDYPDLEIVIVDNGSTDRTVEIAGKYTDKIFFDDGLLGSVRQTGVENSNGRILALFDSDIILPHRKWLVNAVKYFNYSNRVSTVWPMNIAPPDGSLTVRLYLNHWRVIIEDRIRKKRGVFGGGNALFLRDCIEEIGGVNRTIHWGEDFDWAKKLKDRGYQVVFIHDPLYHDTMRSLSKFARKQFVGARTFTRTGFQLMNLSSGDVFYEQLVLGIKGMIEGLVKYRDPSWLLFPLFAFIKGTAYCYISVRNLTKGGGL